MRKVSKKSKFRGTVTARVVVCTPGKLDTWTTRDRRTKQLCPTDAVRVLVIDEADRMLQGSFEKTIGKIRKTLPPKVHLLFFSATFGSCSMCAPIFADSGRSRRPTLDLG